MKTNSFPKRLYIKLDFFKNYSFWSIFFRLQSPDLALMALSERVLLTPSVHPICLPSGTWTRAEEEEEDEARDEVYYCPLLS